MYRVMHQEENNSEASPTHTPTTATTTATSNGSFTTGRYGILEFTELYKLLCCTHTHTHTHTHNYKYSASSKHKSLKHMRSFSKLFRRKGSGHKKNLARRASAPVPRFGKM